MGFISIPVLFYPDDYDPEQYEDLKLKVKLREGTMNINLNTLCQFHETDNGSTILSLADGTIIESSLSYNSFKQLIDKYEATIDVIISNKN
jgi:hypothetical protein